MPLTIKRFFRTVIVGILVFLVAMGSPAANATLTNEFFYVTNDINFSSLDDTEEGVTGDFVYYSQNDPKWKDSPYGSFAKIGPSGCGPTSLAMILATLLKDPKITPVEVANAGADNNSVDPVNGTLHYALLDGAKKIWSFKYTDLSSASIETVMEFVSSGKGYVYMGGRGPAPFTGDVALGTGGHIVAIRGVIEKDDTIIIADPYRNEADKYPKGLVDTYRGTTMGISIL